MEEDKWVKIVDNVMAVMLPNPPSHHRFLDQDQEPWYEWIKPTWRFGLTLSEDPNNCGWYFICKSGDKYDINMPFSLNGDLIESEFESTVRWVFSSPLFARKEGESFLSDALETTT